MELKTSNTVNALRHVPIHHLDGFYKSAPRCDFGDLCFFTLDELHDELSEMSGSHVFELLSNADIEYSDDLYYFFWRSGLYDCSKDFMETALLDGLERLAVWLITSPEEVPYLGEYSEPLARAIAADVLDTWGVE